MAAAHQPRPDLLPSAGPVVAASAGTVISTGNDPAYGNIVTLRHSGNIRTRYAHLASIEGRIRPGATVTVGQRLGVEGSTGTSTGPHPPFQVEINGRPIDPVPFMAARGAPLDGTAIAPSTDSPPPASLGGRGGTLEGGVGFPVPAPGRPRQDSLHNPPLGLLQLHPSRLRPDRRQDAPHRLRATQPGWPPETALASNPAKRNQAT
jgi:Peptidase family M23